ncbi:fimbrial biogenesis outer membrane usher protein [Escherichia coli]|uniref:fimbria/pilus outer membrane usher protein n=1 Tax=Escherichia coli TaxID=562 RepID=UPI0017CDC510|nr:fimbrial biogenesis outer membrane usher protein [Escherichia coli]ELO6050844.1 fimbrial biogenesis outer membrane usher protein [Escherichia coli]HAH0352630.1 fimbrial biogenesis outer membrane usher protein [Escherichia coli]HAN8928923.1 fimbrial biogenesis outer membrane usher protein [Escherichia coli]HCO9438529.1 fimbrial biogenesis outer membrane usher protein [Escherichia coli]
MKTHSKKSFYPGRFSLNHITILLLNLISVNSFASEYVEFDPGFLYGNKEKSEIDIRKFSYGNPVPAGSYIADIYLNETLRGRLSVKFIEAKTQRDGVLCATPDLMALLDLKDEAIKNSGNSSSCELFSMKVPSAKVNFNLSDLRLNIDIPQAFIVQHPKGYISPSQWQDGVTALFVRYDATHYRYNNSDFSSDQTYLGIDSGFSLSGWTFRHRGSQSWEKKRQSYQSISSYAQHDVASMRAQLTLGDFYTSGVLMESVAVRGGQLASDDRMLASSLRGYAPVVRGVANTNALIQIRQNGNLLREVSVPAGPFAIDDLFPTGYGGDINVEILEANGERRTFTIPYTAAAQLIRPGYSRYLFAAGRYRYSDKVFDQNVAQATWQYGLSNDVTFNLGTTFSDDYHAELFGVSVNTPVGAFTANETISSAKINTLQKKYKGYSLSLSYNTKLESTDTNVTLANYRYLSKNYFSLQDTMLANMSDNDLYRNYFISDGIRPKNQLQISVSQPLSDGWGSAYIVGSTYNYWGTTRKQNEYQIGYSNSYKKLNYSLSYSQSESNFTERDKRVYLNFSMPLGGSNENVYLSQTINHANHAGVFSQTTLSGVLGEERLYSYNLSLNHQKYQNNKSTGISFNNSYQGSLARLDGSWSRNNLGNSQSSVGVSGAIVAHPKGITFANDLGNTFAIIHASGAAGARISGSTGNKIDRFGNGIVPHLTPYSVNYVGLENIPDSVELASTEQKVVPRANQPVLVNFETTEGTPVFFELQDTNLPPLGTDVFDKDNQLIGVVAQGGKIYSRGIADKGSLHIKWNNYRCKAAYQIPVYSNNDRPVIVPVRCDFY